MADNFTPRFENALSAKLARVRGSIRQNRLHRTLDVRDPLPDAMTIGEDGVTHINIWENAITDLGQALAHSTRFSFKHPVFGRFNNMESFWHYLRSEERDDRIRVMSGRALKSFATKLTPRRITNFRALIMDANWQKVRQYPEISDAMRDSTMNFDCYYVYRRKNGIRIRPTFAHWMIKGFEEIRMALKNDRNPDFNFLMDDPSKHLYAGLLPPAPVVEKEVVKQYTIVSREELLAESEQKD